MINFLAPEKNGQIIVQRKPRVDQSVLKYTFLEKSLHAVAKYCFSGRWCWINSMHVDEVTLDFGDA